MNDQFTTTAADRGEADVTRGDIGSPGVTCTRAMALIAISRATIAPTPN